jgi:DNA-binding LacI/PurR family transcriptional regulator
VSEVRCITVSAWAMTPTPNTVQASPGRAIGAPSVAVNVPFLSAGELPGRAATVWQTFAMLCQTLLRSGTSVTARQPPRAVLIDAVLTGRRRGSGMVTLHDVAREADVAVSTVSRALSNPDRVSRSTRDHVLLVARKLGYQPPRAGTRTQMLAMLVHDVTNPYNFGLIRGTEAQARAAGYTLVLGDSQQSPELESAHADRLLSSVDGLVLSGSRLPEQRLRELADQRPLVLFNREASGLPSVVMDSVGGSRQIIDHLVALGHHRIGYLAGPRESWTDDERWRALSAAADASGIEIVRHGPFLPTLEQGFAAADVGLGSGVSALVAFNDLLAIGALQRLERRGVDVPGEMSVVGYDDIFGSDFCHPPLTTVTGPVDDAGRTLIDLLLGIATRPNPQVTLPTQLRIRDSTGPCRTG